MISVLCVDDDEPLLDLTRIFLEKTGHFEIETVVSPREALDLLKTRPFDALVSDYEMPEMNGLELLEAVRNRWKNIPFIIFTGRGREEVVIRAFELGADSYLQKGGSPTAQFAELSHKILRAVQGKQADLALRSSEEKFSKAFTLNPVAMAITECTTGRFVDVNDIFIEYTGLRREEVIGKTVLELGLFDDPGFNDRLVAALRRGEKIRNVELVCRKKNGEKMTKLFSAGVFQTRDERFVLSFSLDITDRKRHETELKVRDAILQVIAVSAARLLGARDIDRAISETLGPLGSAAGVDRVYIYAPSGPRDHRLAKLKYEWVADGVEPWIDDPRHNLIPYREVGYSDIAGQLKNGETVLYPGSISRAGNNGDTPAQELCNAAIVPIMVRDAPWGVIGFETPVKKEWPHGILDVLKTSATIIGSAIERNQVENALTESKELYRSLFDASPDGIVIADREGKIRFASPKTVELTGAGDETAMLGTPVLDWIAPEFRETARANIRRIFRDGDTCESRFRLLRKDGSSFTAEISCSALHDAGGETSGMISIFRDVSSRIESDEELRLAHTKLNLLSSITRHDIQNKLTAMTGYLDLLKETSIPVNSGACLRKVDEITAAIGKQLAFTRDYEDLRMKDPEWQNVAQALALVVSQLDMKNIAVKRGPGDLSVYADPLFQKVLYNILDNATRYGETITTVRISSRTDGNDCILTIEDDGVGIPEAMKEKIFKRGFGKNGGFGLFLVQEILGITGMSIRETGEPGTGARFEIRVPEGRYRFAGMTGIPDKKQGPGDSS